MGAIFVDDGGVMNDNTRRAGEWQRLLGEFFAPRLGGTADTWAEANRLMLPRMLELFRAHLREATDGRGVGEFARAERARWLADMCGQVGVAVPVHAEAFAREAQLYVCERAQSAAPGAVAALQALAARHIRLHTASNEESWQLDGYLRAMGARHLFGRLYGPDLLDRWKNGPHYYRALAAHSEEDPAASAVIDDDPRMRGWAEEAGFRAFGSLDEALRAVPS